jgi:Zn-dependent peptidase ImmA (M78 family)
MATGLRRELGLSNVDPLPPSDLAKHLDVPILSLTDIPDLDRNDVYQLLSVDPDSWSAITVAAGGREAIIINSNHRRGRSSTDIMHELAHLLLGHEPSTMFYISDEDIALRGFSENAEDEANWLAGTLLLPRGALVHLLSKGLSNDEICRAYGVSQRLLRMRFDVTGVKFQFGGRRR